MIETYASPQSEPTLALNRRTSYSSRKSSVLVPFGLINAKTLQSGRSPSKTYNDNTRELREAHSSEFRSPRRTSDAKRRSLSTIDKTPGALCRDMTGTKPGIQCDLRRALSLDYQNRFSKLDISAESACYTQGAPLARRSPDRIRRDISENLANRMNRERTRHPSFYDVV